MDANDVEMVPSRSRRDTDEVYPVEEIFENEVSYEPKARRQNRWFFLSIICITLAFGGVFGAKIFMLPQRDAQLEENSDHEQGTVINNAENAKVAEALQQNKKKKEPGSVPTLAPIEPGPTPTLAPIEPGPTPTLAPSHGTTHHKNNEKDYSAWHQKKVTKDDGTMYKIIEVLNHDPKSFTEGLTYYDGKLYESVGLNKQSAVLELDPETGETLKNYPMDSQYFGEGLTYCQGKLIQLTYKKLKGFVYDINNLDKPPTEFDFDTTTKEGWGMTYDEKNDELIVSDGSAFLHFWDSKTFKQKRKHQIMRLDGTPAVRINELEFWRDRVVANVWFEHVLLIINPTSGLVEKEYDFSKIWEEAGLTKNRQAEVFNGIAVSGDPDILYVTGKWWSNMFKIKLLPEV